MSIVVAGYVMDEGGVILTFVVQVATALILQTTAARRHHHKSYHSYLPSRIFRRALIFEFAVIRS
jgi:hypothetical protein